MRILYDKETLEVKHYATIGTLFCTGCDVFDTDDSNIFLGRIHTDYKMNSDLDGVLLRDSSSISLDAQARALVSLRKERDQLLLDSDWRAAITDYPAPDKDAWLAYRQLLRDLPESGDPLKISIPSAPDQVPEVIFEEVPNG